MNNSVMRSSDALRTIAVNYILDEWAVKVLNEVADKLDAQGCAESRPEALTLKQLSTMTNND